MDVSSLQVIHRVLLGFPIYNLLSEGKTMFHRFVSGLEPIGSGELPAGDLIAVMLKNGNVDRPFPQISQLIRHRPNLITVVSHTIHSTTCLLFSP